MAFSAFGSLGSEGAAGFLGGMQTAAQRMEKQKQTRDSEAMQMYSKLLASGEYEPVGPDGSPDGGIIRIGNVGMLRQKKASGIPKNYMRDLNYASQIKARDTQGQPKEGEIRSYKVQIEGPKGGKVPGIQKEKFVNGKWELFGGKVVTSRPSAIAMQTWVRGDERVTLPKADGAPAGKGWLKYSDFSRDRAFVQREDAEQARIVGTKLRTVRDSAKRLEKWMGIAPDETSKQYQDQYKSAYVEAAGLEAEQKALAKGAPTEIRDRLVEEAQAKARRELAEKYPDVDPEEDEGLIDWILKRITRSTEAEEEDAKRSETPFKKPGGFSLAPKSQPLQQAIGRNRR